MNGPAWLAGPLSWDAPGPAAPRAAEVTDAAPGWVWGCRRRAPARAGRGHLADGDPAGMVTGAGYRPRGERTSKLSPTAWLYAAAVMAAAVAVLAQALGADSDLDGPVSRCWTMAVLVLLFLICDSTPTAVASRQSAWSPSSSVTLDAVVQDHGGAGVAPPGHRHRIRPPGGGSADADRLSAIPAPRVTVLARRRPPGIPGGLRPVPSSRRLGRAG